MLLEELDNLRDKEKKINGADSDSQEKKARLNVNIEGE